MREDTTWAVKAAREGDPDAWDALLKRHQRPLYVFVAELVRDSAASPDIVQEAFIAATKHIGSLRDDRSFTSWLFTIARQQCARHWRHRREPDDPIEAITETCGSADADPGEILVREEEQAAFLSALDRLPASHREVLILRFLEEFSLEEIAGIVAVPVGTVKSRLHHARRALIIWMKDESAPRNPVVSTR